MLEELQDERLIKLCRTKREMIVLRANCSPTALRANINVASGLMWTYKKGGDLGF